jgi:hypothetical protein
MSLDEQSVAYLLASKADDSFRRFLQSLSPSFRGHAEEAQRMHGELSQHITAALTSESTAEAMSHAQWVREHVCDVAYRWLQVRKAYEAWLRLDARPSVAAGPR